MLKGNNGSVYHQSEQLTEFLQPPVSYGDVPMQFFLHVLYGANKNVHIDSFQLIRKQQNIHVILFLLQYMWFFFMVLK